MNYSCSWLCRLFCFLGLHRWDMPGGKCEYCKKSDDFFDGGYG